MPGLNNVLNQIGYSRSTPVPVTNDSGLTFGANLSNPVPSGTLLRAGRLEPRPEHEPRRQPRHGVPDRTQEPDVLALQHRRRARAARPTSSSSCPISGRPAATCRWSSRSTTCPQEYRTQSAIRDNAAETFLTQTVANPFQGLFPDNPGASGSTIARRRLLLAYPHFDTLSIETYRGTQPLPRRCWRASTSASPTA